MTEIHSCSYYCDRPECIKRQRDDLRDSLEQIEGRIDAMRTKLDRLVDGRIDDFLAIKRVSDRLIELAYGDDIPERSSVIEIAEELKAALES